MFPTGPHRLRHLVFSLVVGLALTPSASAQFSGRVVILGAERSGVVVSLQRENGQVLREVFTSVRGTFVFESSVVASRGEDSYYYVVIEEEGFKPYKQRIEQQDLRGRTGTFTIYLDPLEPPRENKAESIDITQSNIPQQARRAYEEASKAAQQGNVQRAIDYLEDAVKIAPSYSNAWIDLGGHYDRLGKFDDARNAYLKARDANPRGVLPLINLGAMYYQKGDRERAQADPKMTDTFSRARQWLESALAMEPGSVRARFYLGATLFRLGEVPESEQLLRSVLDLDKSFAGAQMMLINVYSRLQRYQDALDHAKQFLADNPTAPEKENIERVKAQLEGLLKR